MKTTIKSNQFNHNLKQGALITIPAKDSYGNTYATKITYIGRDAERFWGLSLQHGGLVDYQHCEIELTEAVGAI